LAIRPRKYSPTTRKPKKVIRKYSSFGSEGRIPFYDFLSDEERRLFTTTPREVTA
jgi:hypothetical protein